MTQLLQLKEILQEVGMTGKDLSGKLGITETSMSRIINGMQFPKPELLKEIAKVLDIDIRDLFIPTKKEEEPARIYIKVEGKYIPIGSISLSNIK